MPRKFFSGLFLIVSLVVGVGAFGHASQWWRHVAPALSALGADPKFTSLLFSIWLFVSGCMLSFGVILVWVWLRMRKGDQSLLMIPMLIGAFYLVAGVLSCIWVGPFFALFVVLGFLLCLSALGMRRAQTAR
ncbi:MAG TPA: hypothetical protein VGM16_12660 [Gammaproteobacteria bacterium]|jgi:hypothetical membrane protein